MQHYTSGGECGEGGDYLSWDEMQWKLHGHAVVEEVDVDEPCMGEPPINFYPAGFRQMKSCMHFCEKLGSRSPSVTTLQEWEGLLIFLSKKRTRKNVWLAIEDEIELPHNRVWLPLDDTQNEGEWRDYYTHQILNFTPPWYENEPNGGKTENCIKLPSSAKLLWTDVGCAYSAACLCERLPLPRLKLQGLCQSSALRSKYYHPMNNLTNFASLVFMSMSGSYFEYDIESRRWKLIVPQSNMTGSSKAAHYSFALGKHNWTISGDLGCTIDGEEYTTELKLSGCTEGHFTCNDGQCVSMEKRCDQLSDCRDKSDEENCNILVLEKSYNKNVPPVSLDNGKKEMVNVSVSIDLLTLVDINEPDYSIEIQFAITLQWIENRATYQHLKNDRSLNALTLEDIQQLWLPKVIYENTDQKESTRLGAVPWEWETIIVVEKMANGTLTGLDIVDEKEVFEGNANNLVMFQTYTHEFQCIYDLRKYPFDTQTCSINMAMGALDWTSVRLIPDSLCMNQSLDMPIFQIVHWYFKQEKRSDERMPLNMVLVLKRKITSELMTTYFPTLLLTAITFATTFFKPFFFEAALSVNLTTMLVMTTIFISKMENLPPTSDIKMIDIWLILCQIYPFLEVVLLTAMEYNREDENGQRSGILSETTSSLMRNEGAIVEQSNARLRKLLLDVVYRFKAPNLKTLGRLSLLCN